MHVKASVSARIWAWFALFSILLFHPTVFFHFTEQINDDDDDDDDDIDWYFKCYAKNLERLFLLKHGVYIRTPNYVSLLRHMTQLLTAFAP